MRAPRRIFVRMPNWVGDVLMATPVLRALRNAHPEAEIHVCARRHVLPLLRGLPSVDALLEAPKPGVGGLWSLRTRLRSLDFDEAILLPDSVNAALGPFLARIPLRVGYARDAARRTLLTHALRPPSEAGQRLPISMVERYLRITREIGVADAGEQLDLVVDSLARDAAEQRLRDAGIGSAERIVVVTPGASFGASKLWPAEHFAEACDRLSLRTGLRAVLAPGPGEEAVAQRIIDTCKSATVQLADPPTKLAELAGLIERAELVLSNDTGPRHMAVALGTPVIALLGPTDPRHTQHLLEQQRILREEVECSPCHLKVCPTDHRCMTRLSPERVESAALELLG